MTDGKKIRDLLNDAVPFISLKELAEIQQEYPYFQTVRFLYLKKLYKENPARYREELEKNAIFASDRKSLFYLLESSGQSWTPIYKKEREEKEKEEDPFSLVESFLAAHAEELSNEKDLIPTVAASAVSDYLAVTCLKEAETETTPKTETESLEKNDQIDLIDSFIEKTENGITWLDKEETISEETLSPEEVDTEVIEIEKPEENTLTGSNDEAFLTESLAKIYIKQRRYSKALEIIKKLSLKYPEKNIYFADQIRFLEKLITNIKSE